VGLELAREAFLPVGGLAAVAVGVDLTETASVCHRTTCVFDRRSWPVAAVLTAGVAWLSPFVAHARGGGGRGLCATAAAEHSAPPYVAVVSAFPAELAPVVAATEIETTVQIAGRSFNSPFLTSFPAWSGVWPAGAQPSSTHCTGLGVCLRTGYCTGALGFDGYTTCHAQAYMDATYGQSTTTNCNLIQ